MNVVRLIVMVVLQAVLLEAVSPFGEWTQPQWALWALFMLPPQSERFTKLGFGFLLGLGLDLMMGTYGHHMVAGTVLGGVLPGLHQLLSPREGYEVTQKPTLRDLGLQWVLALSFLGSLLFHLALMVVDTWHAHLMLGTLMPALTSAIWTTCCCLLLHLLVVPPGRKTKG